MKFTDFTKKINIGDAYGLINDRTYARVTGFDTNSAQFEGEYAVVYLTTPYGTKIRTGRAYLKKFTELDDLNQLFEYEDSALRENNSLYGGELDNVDYHELDKQNAPLFADLVNNIENEFAPLPGWFPLEVQLELTYECPYRCLGCYNEPRAIKLNFAENLAECKTKEMTQKEIDKFCKIVDTCLENGARFFTITGGEPTLYPELVFTLIRKIKAAGGYVSINTSSSLITDEYAKELKDAGLNSALTSLHGSDEEVNAKFTYTEGSFEKTVTGIKHLLNNGIHVVPNFVATHANVHDMVKTAEMLYHMGIKRQAFSIFIPTPNVEHHKPLIMTKEDYQTYFNALKYLNDTYPDLSATATLPVPPCLAQELVGDYVLEGFEHRTCPSGRQFIVVNINGDVSPCIQRAFDEKYGRNILDNPANIVDVTASWKKIMNTPEKCMNCEAKAFCNPCNMNILANNDNKLGINTEPYPEFPPVTKENAKKLEKKFSMLIPTDENTLNKTYKLSKETLFRKESNGYITVINPHIQGYTVISGVDQETLEGNIRFNDIKMYKLFKAMNIIKEIDESEYATINGKVIPKYKILTEFIGKNFTNEELVYMLRTDTAGRFFCLANTPEENENYKQGEKIYRRQLKKNYLRG